MIVYFVDNKQVVDLFNKGQASCAKASNSDLYKLLFAFIRDKDLDFTVYWMPSHLDNPQAKTKKGKPKVRPVWVHDHDIKGNKEADELADRAAEIAELPSWLVDPLIDTLRMVRCIQLRLATIVCNLPRRQYKKSINHGRAPVLDRNTKDQAMAKSEHSLSTTNMVVQCSECLSKVHFNSPHFHEFMRSPCTPVNVHTNKRICVSIIGQIRIRNQMSHPTHDIYSHRNIQYCNKCGYMVKRRMQNLIKPCNGSDRRSIHGQRVLEAIARHELPPGVNFWPDLGSHARTPAE